MLTPGAEPGDALAHEPQTPARNDHATHAYPRAVHFVEEALPTTPTGEGQSGICCGSGDR